MSLSKAEARVVIALRDRTGMPLRDCKRAFELACGDAEAAARRLEGVYCCERRTVVLDDTEPLYVAAGPER